MSYIKTKIKYIMLLIIIFLIYCISILVTARIKKQESQREKADLEKLENVKELIQNQIIEQNLESEVSQWLGTYSERWIKIGYKENFNFNGFALDFPQIYEPLKDILPGENSLASEAIKKAERGIYVYIKEDFDVYVSAEVKEGTPQKCDYIDSLFLK